MRLTEVRLRGFRNYKALDLVPAPHMNVLIGENAAGKTNVLESLFFGALGKSHRTPRDAELILHGEENASVDLRLETNAGTRTIGIRLSRSGKKRLLIDGRQLSRSGELMGCLNVVLFAPEDLSLVKDGPGERRRFLNMALSQQDPRYYYLLQVYNAALKQRNALLRSEELPPEREFLPWEEQLAGAGSAIRRRREAFCGEIARRAEEIHCQLSQGKERLRVTYRPDAELVGEGDEKALLERLAASRRQDAYRGGTATGPHRDDFLVELDGRDARSYGSQGQQRTSVLSLKMAELDMVRELRGESPVLLLDDVFSELDADRRRMLLMRCADAQTFITCTQMDVPDGYPPEDLRILRVCGGALTEEE